MWQVPGLFELWVSTAGTGQNSGGAMAFNATANVTNKALSSRAADLPGTGLLGVQP